MASDLDDLADPERRLCEVLAAYFEAVKAGQAPEREAWLARYPDLAGQLAAFLEQQDRLLRVTEPLRTIAGVGGGLRFQPIAGPGPCPNDNGTGSRHGRVPRSMSSATTSWSARSPAAGWASSTSALQLSLNRPVALKMLRGGTLAERGRPAAVPHRGGGGRQPRPPEHRADLRGGRARGLQLLRMKLIEGASLAQRSGRSTVADPRAAAQL